ncbi:MAG TPA: site-2 protease family protein [Verrucomicrobiae bacterium]|jgi:Zn-dependent protease|nr:site-2 protease family protein [Verrucomicrobiae bacterium]
MDAAQLPPPVIEPPKPAASGTGKAIKRAAGPVAALGALLAKMKLLLLPLLKILPYLKTGGTMFISCWLYARIWGWWYAFGFVMLIFVHECGHLIAAKRLGLKVGAPVFIPFLGALIALKQAPRNAWIEAQVGIGGPLLGALGAVACYVLYAFTGNGIFSALAFTGFFLNLFNLAPIGFLDGGRIVTALSPWLWLVGVVVIGAMMLIHFNLILLLIFVFSLPRLYSLFRKKSAVELRYYEVLPEQRWIMAILYFGLILFLVVGMFVSHVQIPHPVQAE